MGNLKKHIKKRFHFEVKLPDDVVKSASKVLETTPWSEAHTIKKVEKGSSCLLHYDNGNAVLAFPFRHDGEIRWVPEPDPILIFFNTAYYNYKQVLVKRNEVLNIIGSQEMNEGVINNLYEYFGLVSTFVISLFASLEAFTHKVINDDFIYRKESPKRTELYTKAQLDPIPFDEKLKAVLPQATGKNFSKSHPVLYTTIMNLKEFRNCLVHLKADTSGHTPYDAIFRKSFQYNFEDALNAVKDFMNYYHPHKPNYVEECDCSGLD